MSTRLPPRQNGARALVMRNCLAIGCGATINEPLLMCVHHWRLVPSALRRQIWASYARRQSDPSAIGTHLNAVQAAIDAVHGKQTKRKAVREAATRPLF
jgi:hypothetical protein